MLLASPGWAASLAGKPAPPLTATTLDGLKYSLQQHRGEVVIVNFWATWCGPCRVELPAFEAFYQAHHDDGLSVLAISVDDADQTARVRALAQDFDFPVALGADVQAGGYGRIWRLPITFVIDRAGVLRIDGGVGARVTWDLSSLEKQVGPLLRER
ncbi:peroxiredoxin family protein [Solimonas terrae]|uniref:TlpA family protein disulfide reductase n=1 Tax=Solimonas terrae TaxID=1396819 RepID=A0A6M2BT35_9GAMM|nr:TlpA disulfide reductase family protein [Solimonas terrae]NGY05385.1 TlpA family protein disulfide reductase [Solimonas terrae]